MKYLLLFLPFLTFAQPTFTEHIVDTSSQTIGTKKLVPVDLNSDGNLDLATINMGSNEVYGYQNTALFNFGQRQTLADSIDFTVDVCFGDFDGNGWEDMAIMSQSDKNLIVSFNQNGVFENGMVVDSNYFFPIQVFAEDFTNDGFEDILAVDDTVVRLLVNDGMGNFSKKTVAKNTEYYCAGIGDLNGDGLPDVLLGSVKLYTYLNSGNGNFTRDTRNETLINQIITQIEIADIDGDGDRDAAIYYTNSNSTIEWFANDSTAALSIGGTITNTADDVKNMRLADLTGNGLPDFVTAYGQTGKLIWIKNLGAGNYGSENVLKKYSVINRAVAVADADNDGDLDIYCGHNFDGIFLWENHSPTASISENGLLKAIWPNPVKDAVKINLNESGSLQIYTTTGKLVFEKAALQKGENHIELNLYKGVYIFNWRDGQQMFSQKLIVE